VLGATRAIVTGEQRELLFRTLEVLSEAPRHTLYVPGHCRMLVSLAYHLPLAEVVQHRWAIL
jgi:hypothetical protein